MKRGQSLNFSASMVKKPNLITLSALSFIKSEPNFALIEDVLQGVAALL